MIKTTNRKREPMPPKLDEKSPTERLQIIAPASWIAKVNEWRGRQPDPPNKSEAIRMLVEIALASEGKGHRTL